jgi:hypothetical protein
MRQSDYPLPKWDHEIAPYLHAITSHAHWLSYHGRGVIAGLTMLPARPQWPTQAEEALQKVEQELTAALELTQEARRKYGELLILSEAAE